MAELAIAAACGSIAGSIITLTKQIGIFVISVSDAQKDMEDVRRELTGLLTCLQTLRADTSSGENEYPDALVTSLLDVLKNCGLTMAEMATLLDKMMAPGLARKMQWSLVGENHMKKLRFRLEAHKSTLEIALVMTSMSVTSSVKRDVANIKNDTIMIGEVNENVQTLVEEIQRLRIEVAKAQPLENDRPYALQRFLDESSNYAESIVNGDEASVPERTNSTTFDWSSAETLNLSQTMTDESMYARRDHVEDNLSWEHASSLSLVQHRNTNLEQQSVDRYETAHDSNLDLRKTKTQERRDKSSSREFNIERLNTEFATEPLMKTTSMPESGHRQISSALSIPLYSTTRLLDIDRAFLRTLGTLSQQTLRLPQIVREREAEAVERLLVAGANPHALGWEGDDEYQTHSVEFSFGGRSGHVFPIEIAARKGRVDVLVVLFRHGAQARKQMERGSVHLFGSAINATVANYQGDDNRWNQANTVQYLLEKGVDVNSRNALGFTALQYSKSHSSDSDEQSLKILRLLLEKGADVNCDAHQNAPLVCELLDEQLATAAMLVKFGANVNKKCLEHGNALLHAMKTGQTKMARFLLEHGADVNAIDHQLDSPLLVATESLDDAMVRELLRRGADVAYEGSNGNAKVIAQRKRRELTGSFSQKTQGHMRYCSIWMSLQKTWSPYEDGY